MRNSSYLFILCAVVVLVCGCGDTKAPCTVDPSLNTPAGNDSVVFVPDVTQEEFFFGEIDNVTKEVGLTELRKCEVAPGSLEVRVWSGFGIVSTSGYVLKKDKSTWTGHYIPGDDPRVLCTLGPPTSGWDLLWQGLEELGILTLPDSSELEGEVEMLDGIHYVVEILTEDRYRTYAYHCPDTQPWPEAKALLKIMGLLGKEFDPSDVPYDAVRPVIEACMAGDLDTMRELLEGGADPDWTSLGGYSLLHAVASQGWTEGTALLARHSKLVNHQSANGMTALHEAVRTDDHVDTVKVLLEAGADPHLQDTNGRTPLDWAVSEGHQHSAQILGEAMSR